MLKKLTLFLSAIWLCTALQAQFRYEIPRPKPLCRQSDTVSVFIIGDVMMHSRQMEYDCREFFRDISREIGSADISVANMEFTLAGEPYSGYPAFSAPDSYAHYIQNCGTDVFLLANNHINDKGTEGLERTLGIYSGIRDSLGAQYTGVGNEPLLLHCKGLCLAFINFTYGLNSPQRGGPAINMMSRDSVGKMFRKARERGADFIVALPHWGEEYELHHSREQQEWAEWMVSQGADVIIGSHPHVVQDTTHINGVPVVFSVGNAVSNMSAANTQLELAVTLKFAVSSNETAMLEPSLEFMWCSLPGMFTDNYSVIHIKKWANRKSDWLIESDFNRMIETYKRVKDATGITD